MATYAIGDVQGCYDELRALLDKFAFDPDRDRLWLVGDLVNRGPASLEVLRFVRALGDSAITVLGNHDLYLLKLLYSERPQRKRRDTLQAVLDAPDRAVLTDWLRSRPLLHVAAPYAMVHAGLLPCWTLAQAQQLAREIEAVLQGPGAAGFLADLWGDSPGPWSDKLTGIERQRFIVNAMTRMRFCNEAGRMDFEVKGSAAKPPRGHRPWFEHAEVAWQGTRVIFGHWSALGLHVSARVFALDTGCVWGRTLTGVCLEDERIDQVPAVRPAVVSKKGG